MQLQTLLPIVILAAGYYIAEGAPPPLPQGERYISSRLFGPPAEEVYMTIAYAAVPNRSTILGQRVAYATRRAAARSAHRVIPVVGWDPEIEFAKMKPLTVAPAMPPRPAVGCPIPSGVWEAIDDLSESPQIKGLIAAAAYVESRWDCLESHYDSDGGYSHGLFQLHGKWRAVDVAWMKQQPGGWRDPRVNLAAFLRTLEAHEKYYPQTKGSWKLRLSHYNGGSQGNLRYAAKCLKKAKDLEQWFA